ncbi:MAG: FAD-dependent oxidoreductase [Dehalobacterium sp.]
MYHCPIKKIESDVLIIGGGLAALMAAGEAVKKTSRVTVVCKKRSGASGNTLVSGAGFAAFFPGSEDSLEQYFIDTMNSGKGLSEKILVETLVNRSNEAILEMENRGVIFPRTGEKFSLKHSPGHSVPRSLYSIFEPGEEKIRGISVLKPLVDSINKSGVKCLNHTPVFRLITRNQRVIGALGIDVRSQEFVWLPAKAIVLASGGGGRIFSQNNNTGEMTGDSYSLALYAGAVLRDMEFVQFYPTMMHKPVPMPFSTSLFGAGAVLRNALGERFMVQYAPREGDMATRDRMSQAIFSEINEGRGVEGEVFLDCTGISYDTVEKKYRYLKQFLAKYGKDINKDFVPVSPVTHFFMGGVKIDELCRTSLEGLFAAGESVGGLHGANRLATNALTEAAVFGRIAGGCAAEFAGTVHKLEHQKPELFIPTPSKGGTQLMEIRKCLTHSMWKHASIVRSEETLRQALQDISRCRNELNNNADFIFHQVLGYYELKGMCDLAEVIARAALLRRESRGSHYREDYLEEKDQWLGSTEVTMENGDINLFFRKKQNLS